MKKKYIFKALMLTAIPMLTACDDLFDPAIENLRDISSMEAEPSFAEGFLANAYVLMPYSNAPQSDVATDDAVSNDASNNYRKMATSSWTSMDDPTSQWQSRFNAIQYINIFLGSCDQVKWAEKPVLAHLFRNQFRGQAFAMRALHQYFLLRAHAGYTADGKLLGYPIHVEAEKANSDFNQERDPFTKCYAQIMNDIDSALTYLPVEYGDVKAEAVPDKYKQMGATDEEYNRAFGSHFIGLMNGKAIETLRAQVALLAASPAYNADSNVDWETAANYAATVLDRIGGVAGMDPTGYNWFADNTAIDNLAATACPKEVIWRGSKGTSHSLETDMFPPSLYGNGRVNPTQNLVDAFPMANGYPISDKANSGYNDQDPYTNRDPRLAAYILYNGQSIGSSVITTGSYGTNKDALNNDAGKSTRTGYYLRKLLRTDVNLNPSNVSDQNHYTAYMRYTEIFLDYAEAANEAWGPTGTGNHSYSAYDIIKALRSRAGVGKENGDAYLESIKNDKDKMRELIRNERRLELCFENHRFYDLRRWKVDLTKLNEAARGVDIKSENGSLKYVVLPTVEQREYKDNMFYGPIPYNECRKWSKLEQNKGWE